MAGINSEIKIIVIDSPDLDFSLKVDSKIDGNCTVKMSIDTYKRLMNDDSTFEIEASNGNLEVSGNSNILKEFGKSLRNSN